jgi:hypothetical protein
MSWTRRFSTPIALRDGRTLVTLGDAHRLMLGLPENRRRSHHWQQAGELLTKAASRGSQFTFAQALAQLPRALKADGLI